MAAPHAAACSSSCRVPAPVPLRRRPRRVRSLLQELRNHRPSSSTRSSLRCSTRISNEILARGGLEGCIGSMRKLSISSHRNLFHGNTTASTLRPARISPRRTPRSWKSSHRPRSDPGPRVKRWAVGVTTAPRALPTLGDCLTSLKSAGWTDPRLFVDGLRDVPNHSRACPRTDAHASSSALGRATISPWPSCSCASRRPTRSCSCRMTLFSLHPLTCEVSCTDLAGQESRDRLASLPTPLHAAGTRLVCAQSGLDLGGAGVCVFSSRRGTSSPT